MTPDPVDAAAMATLDSYLRDGWRLTITEDGPLAEYGLPWTATLDPPWVGSSTRAHGDTYADAVERLARVFGSRR